MRVVAITRVLRIQTRPHCGCVERQLHSRNQKVVMTAVLDIVETNMVHYLTYYFFLLVPEPHLKSS